MPQNNKKETTNNKLKAINLNLNVIYKQSHHHEFWTRETKWFGYPFKYLHVYVLDTIIEIADKTHLDPRDGKWWNKLYSVHTSVHL